ncbi:MAG: hypothetical protein ABIE55_04830 [Candidatus Aenigmatarchaeota archaeon]
MDLIEREKRALNCRPILESLISSTDKSTSTQVIYEASQASNPTITRSALKDYLNFLEEERLIKPTDSGKNGYRLLGTGVTALKAMKELDRAFR